MELLDDATVVDYARSRGIVDHDATVRVEPLSGGVSCAIWRLHVTGREPVVVKQALPRLRVKETWHSDPRRIEREAMLMRLLRPVLGPAHIAQLLLYDEERLIVVMSSAPIDAVNWKDAMLAGQTSVALAAQCGRMLSQIQAIDPDSADVPDVLRDKTYFRQLRIEPYFEFVAQTSPDVARPLQSLCAELTSAATCITHADYTPKNFLVAQGNLILLDHEVGHVGHPAFDVASILNHLYLKATTLPHLAARFRAMSSAFLLACTGHAHPPHLWECLGGLMLARVLGKSPVNYLPRGTEAKVIALGVRLLHGEQGGLDLIYGAPA